MTTNRPAKSFHFIDKSCYRRREEVVQAQRFFRANGWAEAAAPEGADCVILFTCAEMRYKVAAMIREVDRLSGLIRPDAALIVGSCLPVTDPEALAGVFRGRTITPTGFGALNDLPGITTPFEDLPPVFGEEAATRPVPERNPWTRSSLLPYRLARGLSAILLRAAPLGRWRPLAFRLARTRAMSVYVSAGCSKNCTYCAIHFATGAVRSKPPDLVVQAIAQGIRRGYRTFDLLSDSIGGYGLDLGTDLGALLDRLQALPGRFSVGLDDLHPDEFVRFYDRILALSRAGRLSFLFVPIQSANERILGLMNRPCDVPDLMAKLLAVKRRGVYLQTSIIAGFPGETEPEFADTLAFVEAVGFDHVFAHYYCDMPNTVSAGLPDKTDKAAMRRRLDMIGRSRIRHRAEDTRREWACNLDLP